MTIDPKTALLSDRERIDLLQSVVFHLSEHAARMEGVLNVFGYLMTSDVLRQAVQDPDPYQWLQNYISTTAAGCQHIRPPGTDATQLAYVQRGAELAASGFFQGLMRLSGDLDGAPKGPRANI